MIVSPFSNIVTSFASTNVGFLLHDLHRHVGLQNNGQKINAVNCANKHKFAKLYVSASNYILINGA